MRMIVAALLVGAAVGRCAGGQMVKPTAAEMRDALMASSRLSDLEGADGKPFRLKAMFSTWDWKGQPAGDGTLDETWLKPGMLRRVITFRGKTWTQVANGGSVRSTDEDFEGSFMERRLVDALLHAAPTPDKIAAAADMDYKALKVGTSTLDCVVVSPVRLKAKPGTTGAEASVPLSAAEAAKSAYCMSPGTHLLRILQERFDLALAYNKIAVLGPHEIGQEIAISQNGLRRGTLSVTSFVAAHDLTEADFALPPNGKDLNVDDVEIPGTVLAGSIVKKWPPVYPQEAKRQHISGSVVLEALIGEDGTIKELEPVSSPSPFLTGSAIDAVKRWTYKPYLLDGKPTTVQTTITVNYSFSY